MKKNQLAHGGSWVADEGKYEPKRQRYCGSAMLARRILGAFHDIQWQLISAL
jgi:hypothetical protein